MRVFFSHCLRADSGIGGSLVVAAGAHVRADAATAEVAIADDEFVAGIDQVRIFHLAVVLPDLRPQPRFLEETRRNVPEGVALLDDITIRMIVRPFDRGGIHRQRQQQAD